MAARQSDAIDAGKPAVLALVPARGGSKGIPRKNARLLGGKPLVAWAVEVGRSARLVDRVMCTTDDAEIAALARAAGAEIPFLRPGELAQDDTEDWPVFAHALRWLEEHEDWQPDVVVNLRPSSPFRRVEHVDGAIELLLRTGADSVKSVCLARQHPHKMWRLAAESLGLMEPFVQTAFRLTRGPDVPRAELEPVYWQNGLVDATRREVILDQGVMIGRRVAGFVTDPADSVDLDTPLDLAMAEYLIQQRQRANAGA
jgi:CMP-N-acetylneuraminic acid synthetase